MKNRQPVYYGDYLQLKKILEAQATESEKYGKAAHDETLFIIIHQTYELWFKQIIHELRSCLELFSHAVVNSNDLCTIFQRLNRVTEIQKILVDQIKVMETMTTLDFMEFRDFLTPASGFQSLQFRLIEAMLGIKPQHRMEMEKQFFMSRMSAEDLGQLKKAEEAMSLFELVEKWLERMPFSQFEDYDFWKEYTQAVSKMLQSDRTIIESNSTLNPLMREVELKQFKATEETFKTLMSESTYKEKQQSGELRINHKAMLSAVFIYLYRDYPALQMPYQILNKLVEIDENFTTWRYRHAQMVHRILGTKIGTGGSSGHEYLKSTTERNKAFIDFFNLPTFLIPKSLTPKLPKNVISQLDFVYDRSQP